MAAITAESHNAARREAKKRKDARRKADAAARQAEAKNYKKGFEFKSFGHLDAVIHKQKMDEAKDFGRRVTQTINDALDVADTYDTASLNSLGHPLEAQAAKELLGWLEKNPNRYSFYLDETGILYVRKLRKAA